MKLLDGKLDVEDKYVYAGAALVGLPLAAKAVKVLSKPRVKEGKYKGVPVPEGAYDVLVVGGGPSGSTLAYFYAKVRRCLRVTLSHTREDGLHARRRSDGGGGRPATTCHTLKSSGRCTASTLCSLHTPTSATCTRPAGWW